MITKFQGKKKTDDGGYKVTVWWLVVVVVLCKRKNGRQGIFLGFFLRLLPVVVGGTGWVVGGGLFSGFFWVQRRGGERLDF